MSASLLAFITFACTFGGALLGLLVQGRLPPHHVGPESKDTVKITMGLVGSMTALVLGLVTASAKSSYDEVDAAVRKTAIDLVTLDRTLARYGPETAEIRTSLKEILERRVSEIWTADDTQTSGHDAEARTPRAFSEVLAERVVALQPRSDAQKALQARAGELVERVLEERWLMVSLDGAPVPTAFLVILVFWLTATFGSFGLFAPRNGTVLTVLFLGSLSVAASLFLVLELGTPFDGRLKVSGESMHRTLAIMGR